MLLQTLRSLTLFRGNSRNLLNYLLLLGPSRAPQRPNMLSYRHAFHAGNHADVLKHAVQALIIESLKKKEKPFIVLDTHAGGGLYDLRGDWSQKKAEYADGIGRLWDERAQWSTMVPYLGVIEEMNSDGQLHYYPGSPELSRRLAREQDKLALMELHNNEVEDLRANMGYDPASPSTIVMASRGWWPCCRPRRAAAWC